MSISIPNAKPRPRVKAANASLRRRTRRPRPASSAAAAPGEHLPRRVRALAEEEVRRDRGQGADGEPASRPERHARGGDDHGHRLDARDRSEEHSACGGEAAQRRDERQVARRHGAALEPREPCDEDGDRGQQRRGPAAGGVERGPGSEAECRPGGEGGDPRRQRAPPGEPLVFLKHKVRCDGAKEARGRASRRRPPSPTRRTARATRRAPPSARGRRRASARRG